MFDIFLYSLNLSYLALGVVFTHKVGILNISIEGISFLSTFLTALFLYLGFNIFLAVVFPLLINMMFAGLLSVLVFRRYNVFIIGMAINFFVCFLIDFLMKYNLVLRSNFYFGDSFVVVYRVIFIVIFAFIFIFSVYLLNFSKIKISFELIRSKNYSEIFGIRKSNCLKLFAIFTSSIFASLGGSFLSINLGSYSYNLGLSNGWIAICIIYISYVNPILIPFVSFLMLFIQYEFFNFQNYVNPYFTLAMPFYLAILISILFAILNRSQKHLI